MHAEGNFSLIWIIAFPLLGAILNLLFGRWFMTRLGDRAGREVVHLIAVSAVAVAGFIAYSAVFQIMIGQGFGRLVQHVYPWIVAGETNIGLDLMLDHLSAVMVLIITGVGLLIHIFSIGYMAHDPDYHRYFAYLNLFTASMLTLVLGKNLLVTFVGWEGVGVCSYLLIGFWFTDDAKATAGRKAFITNRVGDFGYILGLFAIYAVTQSLDVDAIAAVAAGGPASPFVTTALWGVPIATVATLLLFVGCTGKSAQIPLYVWLPDAMAGPTPVSALIHAATMVTAGVYLIVRLNFLFALAPVTMAIIALVGALTALFAATIGLTQTDIKKVLAYSTVSQLGFMFIAAGMGAWVAAIFHLMTHAFFKACLFLGSGSVIEACHHDQDIRNMGGLKAKMPVTRWTFLLSCLAIAGVPFFSGFFSKDEILLHAYVNESVWSPGLNYVVWALGATAALFTAFYMFRLYFLTFEGEFRGDHHTWDHHVQEYGIMNVPLLVLGFAATFGGFLGVPHVLGAWPLFPDHHLLHDWLEPVTHLSSTFRGDYAVGPKPQWLDHGHVKPAIEWGLMGVSVAIGAAGIWLAAQLYATPKALENDAKLRSRLGGLYRLVENKYWIDELYDAVILSPLRFAANVVYRVFDMIVVDGLGVYGTANAVGALGDGVRRWHNGDVRRYMLFLVLGAGLVLASVHANPAVSKVGPSVTNPTDLGGLRPNLGGKRVKVNLGVTELELGPPARPTAANKPSQPTNPSPGATAEGGE